MTIRDQLEKAVTVPNFRAWLETKDPNEEFCYGDNENCAVAQFVKSFPEFQGREVGVGGDYVRVDRPKGHDNWIDLPRAIEQAARATPSTFGNVLRDLNKGVLR